MERKASQQPQNAKIKPGDVRFDCEGEIRCMAFADGYVMCRRPGFSPFVMSAKKWLELPVKQKET